MGYLAGLIGMRGFHVIRRVPIENPAAAVYITVLSEEKMPRELREFYDTDLVNDQPPERYALGG